MLTVKKVIKAVKKATAKEKKSSAKMYPFRDSDKDLFKDVVFLVEATHHEQHMFWVEFFYEPRKDRVRVATWEQVSMGRWLTIGEVDGRPVAVSINYAILNGKKIMFYEGTSKLVDHQMIEEWIQHYALDAIRYDKGSRWAQCNSMNFHHCLDVVGTIRG